MKIQLIEALLHGATAQIGVVQVYFDYTDWKKIFRKKSEFRDAIESLRRGENVALELSAIKLPESSPPSVTDVVVQEKPHLTVGRDSESALDVLRCRVGNITVAYIEHSKDAKWRLWNEREQYQGECSSRQAAIDEVRRWLGAERLPRLAKTILRKGNKNG